MQRFYANRCQPETPALRAQIMKHNLSLPLVTTQLELDYSIEKIALFISELIQSGYGTPYAQYTSAEKNLFCIGRMQSFATVIIKIKLCRKEDAVTTLYIEGQKPLHGAATETNIDDGLLEIVNLLRQAFPPKREHLTVYTRSSILLQYLLAVLLGLMIILSCINLLKR